MDIKAIADRLRALAAADKRSKAARLRDVIDDVEAALAAGVTRASVVDELALHGLEMSLATFETTLKRIRRKRQQASISSLESVSQPQSALNVPREKMPTIEPKGERAISVVGAHKPTDLDKIINSNPDLAALAKLAKRKPK